jgi:hypothetical protein
MYNITIKVLENGVEKISTMRSPVEDSYYIKATLPHNVELLEVLNVEKEIELSQRDVQGFLDSMVDIYPILINDTSPVASMTVGILTEIIYIDLKAWLVKEPSSNDIRNMNFKLGLLLNVLNVEIKSQILEKIDQFGILIEL